MDDTEIRKDLFAWYGAAMYAAQLFEVELVILLIGIQRLLDPSASIEELDRIDSTLSRKTLGALVRELKKRGTMHPEFEKLLASYCDKRNYLAHRFFYENASHMRTRAGVEMLTTELQGIEQQLRQADAIATKMSENVRRASGIPEEQFQEYVRRLMDSDD